MKKWPLMRIQAIAAPVVMGTVIAAGVITSLVQIRRSAVRRKRWALPVMLLVGILFVGIVAAIVEFAMNAQPGYDCVGGTYRNDKGVTTCRAVLSTDTPEGATARCTDGTYSFNRSASDLCSRHGGVAEALR